MTLPTFIIIGAYKSGTTSLYDYMKQHPDVYMSRVKEPNFFSHEELTSAAAANGEKAKVIDNLDSYLELFSGVTDEQAIGEASPSYLAFPAAAKRIRAMIPDVKLIAILRHPVEAFYSDHYMRVRDGRPLDGDFLTRFRKYQGKVGKGRITGPMYYAQLKQYYDIFDSSQIEVWRYEDLRRDSAHVVQDAYRFVGVDPTFSPKTSKQHNAGAVPRSKKLQEALDWTSSHLPVARARAPRALLKQLRSANRKPVAPLAPEVTRELTTVFRDDIHRLSELIGKDFTGWLN